MHALTGQLNQWRYAARSKIIQAVPPGVRPLVQALYGQLKGASGDAAAIRQVRRKMLEFGYAERGYQEVLALAENGGSRALRLQAYWDLVIWHCTEEPNSKAIARFAECALQLEQRPHRLVHLTIARAIALHDLGEKERAQELLSDNKLLLQHPDLILARAAFAADEDAKLDAINAIFRQYGLNSVQLQAGLGAAFDRLTDATSAEKEIQDQPLISVIVPAHNAQDTIGTAIRSLQQQTWRQIEIIVVDDSSTDATVTVVKSLMNEDKRIRLLRMERNLGAYCARNRGLEAASGEYVTCHDADDWSHPLKLQLQARDLQSRSVRTVANYSGLIFVDKDLRAAARRIGSYARKNTSSLMFRREPILVKLGGWDSVRFSADTEFLHRIYAAFGRRSVSAVDKPLSLVRYREGSLTAATSFGYRGFRMGARWFYYQQYRRFHQSGAPLRFSRRIEERTCYVPEPMLPQRANMSQRRGFNAVLVADCRIGGYHLHRLLQAVQDYKQQGLTVALFHLPLYDVDPEVPLQQAVLELLNRTNPPMLVTGERVECEKLIFFQWKALLDYNRFFLDISAAHTEIIEDATGPEDNQLGAVPSQCERSKCEANLQRYCKAPVTWRAY
ncbi:glycosyltransferase family 2 protein [Nitratireductor aquibiodomus]|uniref:glycosyltransferase family 2 protein n=1 Tax=Nitratireductor aquibiodomus TaxID=204799 RepID=UPI0019D3C039|nr:glycosyltransferase family 2 protein [Nitratireductor aquibiodomus]MBN7762749.1 glycosyltransferase family 2 protein [Nitratireductor aquibiodomus]